VGHEDARALGGGWEALTPRSGVVHAVISDGGHVKATVHGGGGRRTTVRVPEEVEAEVAEIERRGLTRGAAVQQLLLSGAVLQGARRADAEAAEALRAALSEPPHAVPGFPDDESIAEALAEARRE